MPANAHYPRLLAPLRVGRHLLRNRVIMGSMHTRLEYLDHSSERELAFYTERARGGVAMIVSAGCAPNRAGCMEAGSHCLESTAQLPPHRAITAAVHAQGSLMLLQILHAGRYAKHEQLLAPSNLRAPINRFEPRAMTSADIENTIADFIRCATLARDGGYDGVEIMASEGYLITEFTAPRTNLRDDEWGGPIENRCRFAVEIVRGIRNRLGPDFLIMFRISALDLVEDGLSGKDIDYLARAVQSAGADILSTGIGWHEARIPTISYHVPRAAWRFAVSRLKQAVAIPVVASNRINVPELAEEIIASGDADLVALARPLLADPEFVVKAATGRRDGINVCIACNQACLDYIFSGRAVSCLVNPRAGREIELPLQQAKIRRRIAVVGAGPGGAACAIAAAQRGHAVTLFDSARTLGGQLNLARMVPQKNEFNELIRYFEHQIQRLQVDLRLGQSVTTAELVDAGFDHIVIATGTRPRQPDIPGITHPKVASHVEILNGSRQAGVDVVIIGAGGIAVDTAEFLLDETTTSNQAAAFYASWGVDTHLAGSGGVAAPAAPAPQRRIKILQRGQSRLGARLGVSTAWIPRTRLARAGVELLSACRYDRIDDQGLHIHHGDRALVLQADTIVICAGQDSNRALADELQELEVQESGTSVHIIGGAWQAAELDAMKAMDQGTRTAYGF